MPYAPTFTVDMIRIMTVTVVMPMDRRRIMTGAYIINSLNLIGSIGTLRSDQQGDNRESLRAVVLCVRLLHLWRERVL